MAHLAVGVDGEGLINNIRAADALALGDVRTVTHCHAIAHSDDGVELKHLVVAYLLDRLAVDVKEYQPLVIRVECLLDEHLVRQLHILGVDEQVHVVGVACRALSGVVRDTERNGRLARGATMFGFKELRHHELVGVEELLGTCHEYRAFVGKLHATVRPLEKPCVQLVLKSSDVLVEALLRYEEALACAVERAAFRNLDEVLKRLDSHA